eukprot:Amastigsp_a1196_6.p2 type:complete len:243 gc:universal Amastigsp_a1196_6:1389-661(-)
MRGKSSSAASRVSVGSPSSGAVSGRLPPSTPKATATESRLPYGREHVSSSQSTTASEKMSASKDAAGCPQNSSGAHHATETLTPADTIVRLTSSSCCCCWSDVLSTKLRSRESAAAEPKSESLTSPCDERSTFGLLRSPCAMPSPWRYCSAFPTSIAHLSRRASDGFAAESPSAAQSVPPSMYSVMMHGTGLLMTPKSRTMFGCRSLQSVAASLASESRHFESSPVRRDVRCSESFTAPAGI